MESYSEVERRSGGGRRHLLNSCVLLIMLIIGYRRMWTPCQSYRPRAGRHWAMRVGFGVSGSQPGLTLGAGGTVEVIQIRNLDTGDIGTFTLSGLDLGVGIGVGTSIGGSEWAYFETVHDETLKSFQGVVRTPNMQIGTWSAVSRLVLPVDIKHDSVFSRLWNGDSVDVSGTAWSLGLVFQRVEGTSISTRSQRALLRRASAKS